MRGPEVACLQGVLDYYNARPELAVALLHPRVRDLVPRGPARASRGSAWSSRSAAPRCSSAARRSSELGGWDAHNVTEDADLGLRLARHGYRTELVATVTQEEANCRALPWVRQRSRWLKGYAMT